MTPEEKQKSFEEVVMPVIKWLYENTDPHTTIIITNNHAELLEGVNVISTL